MFPSNIVAFIFSFKSKEMFFITAEEKENVLDNILHQVLLEEVHQVKALEAGGGS